MKFAVRGGKIGSLTDKNIAVLTLDDLKSLQRARIDHTIFVVDCSGSMAGVLSDLRDDLKGFMTELPEKEFASVVIFSGHGDARAIAGPTQCNTKGRSLLKAAIDNEVKVIGSTVFSEPLKVTLDTVKRLAGVEKFHNVVMLTDGCAVPTNWGVAEEQRRSVELAKQLSDDGASFSVVGYGNWYDATFIAQLMSAGRNMGIYRHISEIDSLKEVIRTIRDVSLGTVLVDVDLELALDKGSVSRILRCTPEIAVTVGGNLRSNSLHGEQSRFFVELSGAPKKLKVSGNIGGQKVNENLAVDALTASDEADYVRLLAASMFVDGSYDSASAMFELVGDNGLAEKASSAHTDRERRETGDIVRGVFRDRSFIGNGLKPTGPSHCVLNALRQLVEDPEVTLYLPKGAYKRSGVLKRDPRVIENPLGRELKVIGFTSKEDRFNFSLKTEKWVKVKPEEGGAPRDMKIYRTYNVILDGNLHITELLAQLSATSFTMLQAAGVIDNRETYDGTKTYTLNLRGLKMISPNWANPTIIGLVPLLKEEKELEAEQKALNARKKATVTSAILSEKKQDDDESDVYREKSELVTKGVVFETYQAPCCEIRLMSYKAKAYDAICASMTYEAADARVKNVRRRLTAVRWIIRSIVYAMNSVGSKKIPWGAPEEKNYKGVKRMESIAVYDGSELKRVTWTETVECS